MKLFLSITSVGIFGLSFWILKHFYPGAFDKNAIDHEVNLNTFTDMRYAGYAVFGILCWINSSLQYKNEKYWERVLNLFFITLGINLGISDIIDRFCFDITKFTNSDITMLILNVIISLVICKINGEKIKNYLFNLNATQNGRCT